MKVLYLTQWYPNRYDNMFGLFVRKHAEAVVRQGIDVCVLYFHKDKNIKRTEIVEQVTVGIREIYVYYTGLYLKALHDGWAYTKSHWGLPDLCQLNVITKNALLPLWLRLTRHIPYIIVEHWSGYLPQNASYKGFLHKTLAQITVKYADAIMPVSRALEKAMKSHGLQHSNYIIARNVVDDFFYAVRKQQHSTKRILHVSCFDEKAKNVCGILRAIKELSSRRHDFEVVLVGNGIDYDMVKDYAVELGIPEDIFIWTGEQTPMQVAEWFAQSDIFLLYSNYENAPVVISESLATSTPIVSSAVGGIVEMVDDKCGKLVRAQDDKGLANALNYMLDHYMDYRGDYILAKGQQYSYQVVGQQFVNIYEQTIG